ncbi:MAG: ankyrin repeat domain-containing protein [Blastocatellia bacterium]
MQLPECHFIQERILRTLSLHEDSISFERLTRAVAETMPSEIGLRLSDLRRCVKSVLFDLKMSGAIWRRRDYFGHWSEYTPTFRDLAADCNADCNIEALEEMLMGAADQTDKNEALILTVLHNQVEAARVLIKAGADVNAKDKLLGKTAGMYVTKRTKKEMVQLLREAGSLDAPADSDDAPQCG